jgi:hypothetical protein
VCRFDGGARGGRGAGEDAELRAGRACLRLARFGERGAAVPAGVGSEAEAVACARARLEEASRRGEAAAAFLLAEMAHLGERPAGAASAAEARALYRAAGARGSGDALFALASLDFFNRSMAAACAAPPHENGSKGEGSAAAAVGPDTALLIEVCRCRPIALGAIFVPPLRPTCAGRRAAACAAACCAGSPPEAEALGRGRRPRAVGASWRFWRSRGRGTRRRGQV